MKHHCPICRTCVLYAEKHEKKNLLTCLFIGHILTLFIQGCIQTERDTKVCPDTQLDTILNRVLRQICKKDKYQHHCARSSRDRTRVLSEGNARKHQPTFGLDGILVENVDQLILAASLSGFGVVSSVVLQKGEINTFVVLQRQSFDVLQELLGHQELSGAHPVGAQLHSARHSHEALVLKR